MRPGDLFRGVRELRLGSHTLWTFGGQFARTAVQAAYFVLLARALGPRGFGIFAAAAALVGIASPFAGLGSAGLLIRDVARDPASFPRAWGLALRFVFGSGVFLLVAGTLAARWAAPAELPLALMLSLGFAELIFARLADLGATAFLALELTDRSAVLQLLLSVAKLAAIGAAIAVHGNPTATAWSFWYLGANAATALVTVVLLQRQFGRPSAGGRVSRDDLVEGSYFAVGLSAQTVYNDIDKTMLARLGDSQSTGIYAAAYRLIDMAFMPVGALLWASYAKFFQQGERGVRGSLAVAKRLLPLACSYAVLVGAGGWLLVPIVPRVLGPGYALTVDAFRWLAPLPLLKVFHYFLANSLTGAGHQGRRAMIQIVVAAFNFAINLWLIPSYSWRGAAWSSLLSDGLLGLLLFAVVLVLARKERVRG